MRFQHVFGVMQCGKMYTRSIFNCIKHPQLNKSRAKCKIPFYKKEFSVSSRLRDEEEDDEIESNSELYGHFSVLNQPHSRDLVYKYTKDWLLRKITYSASLQELFQLVQSHQNRFRSEHLVQSVLVLCDLKHIYNEVNATKSNAFFKELEQNENFQKLLALIENQIDALDTNSLSFLLLYLTLLGMKSSSRLLGLLSEKLEHSLVNGNFSIGPASRFLQTVFSEKTLKSYFFSERIVPFVFEQIDSCTSVESLHDLTICLNNLNDLMTREHLSKYIEKVNQFKANKLLTHTNYKTILQIILLLNYPKWRNECSVDIVNLILMLENHLNRLNVQELIVVYEVFYKLQEPGKMLSELQRCSSKYLRELEEVSKEKLVLFSALLYFAPTHLRKEMVPEIGKYIKSCTNLEDLLILRKIMTMVKVNDVELNNLYWTKVMKLMKHCDDSTVLKVSQNYVTFNMDLDNYRNMDFEQEMLTRLEEAARDNFSIFPKKLAQVLSSALIYSDRFDFLDYLMTKIEANYTQLSHSDCIKLAGSLKALNNAQNKYLKLSFLKRLTVLVEKMIDFQDGLQYDSIKNDFLMKSCVMLPTEKKNINTLDRLFDKYKTGRHINSKSIENVSYCMLVTSTLHPQIFNDFAAYLVAHPDFELGYNVAKILHLFFLLAYTPKENTRRFFDIAADIIIRDQERMTGLSIIQCAMSLCFYNALPHSLIKSIFNTEFMDKLDLELQNCYSKDKYPYRVRANLMQLNRAVCIDCPESQVPWFHEKYLREMYIIENQQKRSFQCKVKESLIPLVGHEKLIIENFISAYGYKIDFLLNMSSNGRFVETDDNVTKRLAILLIPQHAFTRHYVQLKGKYLLKKRHLEILGYKVIMIHLSDWLGLFYPQHRLHYLSNLIWPKEPVEKLIR